MKAEVREHDGGSFGTHIQTLHGDPTPDYIGYYPMDVWYTPQTGAAVVNLNRRGGNTHWVHNRDGEVTLNGVRQNTPTPELKALLATHHLNPTNTWAPLLDKLAEEYPDMQPAVDAHTAARYS